uniref:Inner membrane protein n=1 Tax=Bursaphelenchus xylophilus TaxID=6326 RepID=A0A1I7S9G2_BURXY
MLPGCKMVTLINDIRTLGKILVIFLPIPIFWTLFDQQYNNFYRQGNEMDLSLGNNLYILPDQMPAFNMLLVVILLPVFHFVIYPLCRLCCKPTYLRKMSAGMLMASLSFLMMCVIQIHLDSRNPFDYSGKAQLAVKNMLTVPVDISYNNGSQQTTTSDTLVKGLDALQFKNDVDDVEINAGRFNIFYEKRPIARARRSPRPERKDKTFTFEDMKHYLIVTLEEGISIVQTEVEKPNSGQAESFQSILFIANDTITLPKIMFCRNNNCDPSSVKNFAVFTKDDIVRRDCCKRDTLVSLTKVKNLLHGSWCVYTEDDLNLKQKGFCFNRDSVGGVHILIAQDGSDRPGRFDWPIQ